MQEQPSVSISGVFRDAWALYRVLWRRSVVVGGLVFALVAVASLLAAKSGGRGPQAATLILGFAGIAFVQGVLVESVRAVHEGRPQLSWRSLYERGGALFPALLFGSILYGLGVGIGAFLFLIPGLLVLARWSVFAPALVLEGLPLGNAFRRSNQVVRGHTLHVLATLIVMYIAITAVGLALGALAGLGTVGSGIVEFTWQALAAPYEAHILTALYYRLVEPQRPIVHPAYACGE